MMEGATIPAGEGLISYYTQYPQFGQFRNGEKGGGRVLITSKCKHSGREKCRTHAVVSCNIYVVIMTVCSQ